MDRPRRVLIIGLDAPIAHRIHDYARRGFLPTFKRLMDGGVYAENYLVPYPTVTPENWTTIATGANIGTHGITGFTIHLPGEDLDKARSAWDTSLCKAEYIWESAERAGMRSIIINWPCSYPATVKGGCQLGGTGLAMNEWRTERGILYRADLSDGQLFTTEDLPFSNKITVRRAAGWRGVNQSAGDLEAELKLRYSICRKAGKAGEELSKVRSPERWYMLIQCRDGCYDRVTVSRSKDVGEALAVLLVGEWSETIIEEFETEDGVVRGAFKLKLLELSRDGRKVSLLVTPICNLNFYTHPKDLSEEVAKVNPLALPSHIFFDGFSWGWYDEETFIELVDMEHKWFVDAATHLMRSREWSLLLIHMHAPDWMYHYAAPLERWDPSSMEYEGRDKAEAYERVELMVYKSIDRAIGKILEEAGEDVLVVIVSDHGARAKGYNFSPIEPLKRAGLLTLKETQGGVSIDLERSKAIPAYGPWIYVNLKGRYSHGIVDPSEYGRVQDEIIDALYSYVDPETGERPVALAVKKRDARLLGLYGDRVGDVIYAVRDDYGGHHGQLPTCEYGIGSLKGLLIMAGPGIKRGYTLKGTVHATDIVPTICQLTGIPLPRDAEGRVIYQALEDHRAATAGGEEAEEGGRKRPGEVLGTFQVES